MKNIFMAILRRAITANIGNGHNGRYGPSLYDINMAHITRMTKINHIQYNLNQSIEVYNRLPLVYSLVQLGLGLNNGTWVFLVPLHLELFIQITVRTQEFVRLLFWISWEGFPSSLI